ncbi:hypothetical protein [Candidatus Nitronereus thalassa]|uniref:Uncharacterized protein n=1 Tax=Candidatus Nitronereus thalassa TaxID=3020898 RepID=A0ABU3K378_9BACT|nr:hypothetical protein [Candidatus Nitronereus thalassa]MDT7040838.1 hypothetical protein [Candidatus Nitronereus thalassa]
MTTQLSILDECQRRTEQALERVDANADEIWMAHALKVVERVAKAQYLFSTNDLWPHLDQPREPRALGAVMSKAQAMKWIWATAGFTESNRPTQHRQPIRLWRSLIFVEEQS